MQANNLMVKACLPRAPEEEPEEDGEPLGKAEPPGTAIPGGFSLGGSLVHTLSVFFFLRGALYILLILPACNITLA